MAMPAVDRDLPERVAAPGRALVGAATGAPTVAALLLAAPPSNAASAIAAMPGATAKHWFAEFTSRGTRACLARLLHKALTATARAQGFTLGPVTTRSLAVAPVGDQDSAFRVSVPVSTSGLTLKVDADAVFVRAGRGIEIFALAGVGSPFDPALEARVVNTVTGRLASDLRRAP